MVDFFKKEINKIDYKAKFCLRQMQITKIADRFTALDSYFNAAKNHSADCLITCQEI